MYTAVTGIWQTVWMEPVAPAAVDSLTTTPDIDKGRLADMGAHDQLLSRCAPYRHLWNQQMRLAG